MTCIFIFQEIRLYIIKLPPFFIKRKRMFKKTNMIVYIHCICSSLDVIMHVISLRAHILCSIYAFLKLQSNLYTSFEVRQTKTRQLYPSNQYNQAIQNIHKSENSILAYTCLPKWKICKIPQYFAFFHNITALKYAVREYTT